MTLEIESSNYVPLSYYETKDSAGLDLYVDLETPFRNKSNKLIINEDNEGLYIGVNPFERLVIPTGIIMKGFENKLDLELHIRSSVALNKGLILLNGVGVIDADYPKSLGLLITNLSQEIQIIRHRERLAQGVFKYIERITEIIVNGKSYNPIKNTVRKGGFGSTGKN